MAVIRAALATLVAAIACSGCAAAGLAAGPLMSAVQAVSDRSVERTVAADLPAAVAATEAALVQMAFRVESREQDEGVRRLRAVADGITVHARVERLTVRMSRVAIRVETGGLLADRDTSTELHRHIATLVTPKPGPDEPRGAAEALTSLQGEVQRLRSEMAERRTIERPAPASEPGGSRVDSSAIVEIPLSAALPTADGPAPSVSLLSPIGVASPQPVATPASPSGHEPADHRIGTALQPAGALTPIPSATEVGRSK